MNKFGEIIGGVVILSIAIPSCYGIGYLIITMWIQMIHHIVSIF